MLLISSAAPCCAVCDNDLTFNDLTFEETLFGQSAFSSQNMPRVQMVHRGDMPTTEPSRPSPDDKIELYLSYANHFSSSAGRAWEDAHNLDFADFATRF
jgi:hypothetical protein